MRSLVFLGSGVSYASGLPNVDTLTTQILEGDWHRHSDSNYYSGSHPHEYWRENEFTLKVQKFLQYIRDYCDTYLKGRGRLPATYEDIYSIVKQLHDELSGESDNPAIAEFIKVIRKDLDVEINPDFSDLGCQLDLSDFCWRTEDFINCAIWHSLYLRDGPVGFDLLEAMNSDIEIEQIDIVTVNHDLLVEKYMHSKKINITDGFSIANGDIRYFKPDEFDIADNKVRLCKLHGSINLYRLRITDKSTGMTTDFYTKISGDHWHVRDAEGKFLGNTLNSYPIFLTGTTNKLADYYFGINKEMHRVFDDMLRSHDTMIMSGYGWNDKGINGRLMEWIFSSSNKKLILLHEDPESIKKSRSAMWHRYDDLVKWGRLIPVKKWFSATKLEDIMPLL